MGVEIALAVGLTGVAATAGGAVINAGLGLALSWGAQRLTGRKSSGASAADLRGARLSLEVAADAPRTVVLGETAVAGSLNYWHLTGADNERLCLVIPLADHECDSLQAVIVDGVRRAWDSATGVVAETNGKLRVKWHSGTFDQVADAEVVAGSGGAWTTNHRGRAVCYVVAFVDYDEATWPGGIPQLGFVIRGHNRLLDPRTGLRGYSDNWGVAVHNLLLGVQQFVGGPRVVGLHASIGSIASADVLAACNASDELVAHLNGTEKRYLVGAELRSDQTGREALEQMLPIGAGELVESAGLWRVLAGVAQTPVATLTDADLILEERFSYEPLQPRSELVNTIEATWLDPAKAYVPTPLPARSASADVAADNGVRLVRGLDLTSCPSRPQAQRVMEVERRRARRQGRANFAVRARWQGLEPGDWISVTSDRRQWVASTFVVSRAEKRPDGTVSLALAEVDAGIDDWTTALEIPEGVAVTLPSAGPETRTVAGLTLGNYLATAIGGAQRPGLRAEWTPVTDRTAVSLLLEYRAVGDAVAQQITVPWSDSGQFSWVGGVQGGVTYEARVRLVTQPERSVDWTPWVAAPQPAASEIAQAAVVAETAAVAEAVPPGTITGGMLSPQTALEVGLTTAPATVPGSVQSLLAELEGRFERIASAIDMSLEVVETTNTRVTTTQRTVVTTREALAQQITEAVAVLQIDINTRATGAALQVLEGRVTTAEGTVTAQGTALTQVQSELNTAEGEIDGLQAGLATANTNIAATSAGLSSLTTTVTTLNGTVTAQGTALTQVQSELNTAEGEIDGLQAGLATANTNIAATSAGLSSLTTTVTTLNGTVTAQGTALTGLDTRITAAESVNTGQATTLTSLQTQVTTAQTTANGRNKVFSQTTTPTAVAVNDLWIKTNDNNRLYRANAVGTGGWVLAEDQRIPALQTTVTAQATSISSLSTTVGAHTATLTQHTTSINGMSSAWTLEMGADGYVVGSLQAGASGSHSFFGVTVADFFVAAPGVAGGAAKQVFVVGNVNGVPGVGINGNLHVDGSIDVRHLNTETLHTLYISDPSNTYFWDFANGREGRTDGSSFIDWSTGEFQFG